MNSSKSKVNYILVAIIAGCFSVAVFAQSGLKAESKSSDLWVQSSKGGVSSVEFASDGQISGLQFEIPISEKAAKSASLSCGSKLPSSHTATCTQHPKFVRVIVFSMTSAVLPDATLVTFNASSQSGSRNLAKGSAKEGAVKLSNVILADTNGEDVTPDFLK